MANSFASLISVSKAEAANLFPFFIALWTTHFGIEVAHYCHGVSGFCFIVGFLQMTVKRFNLVIWARRRGRVHLYQSDVRWFGLQLYCRHSIVYRVVSENWTLYLLRHVERHSVSTRCFTSRKDNLPSSFQVQKPCPVFCYPDDVYIISLGLSSYYIQRSVFQDRLLQ